MGRGGGKYIGVRSHSAPFGARFGSGLGRYIYMYIANLLQILLSSLISCVYVFFYVYGRNFIFSSLEFLRVCRGMYT